MSVKDMYNSRGFWRSLFQNFISKMKNEKISK